MSNTSYWSEFVVPPFPAVDVDAQYDVVVIGGGISGLTTALLLKQAGKSVCVLEKQRIGSGETSRTSGHLTYVTDLDLRTLKNRFGEDDSTRIWRGGAAAITVIEELCRSYHIECNFQRVDNYIYSSPLVETNEIEALRAEQLLAVAQGFDAEFLEHGPIAGRAAVRYPQQAILHPLKYLAGLAAAISGNGSVVHECSEVVSFDAEHSSLQVNGCNVRATDVVIATNVPLTGFNNTLNAALFQTKLFPYSSYCLHAFVSPGGIPPWLVFGHFRSILFPARL